MKRHLISTLALFSLASAAHAAVFTGSDAFGRDARAEFTVVGTDLLVTLTNTATADVLMPIDVLTGVLWSMPAATLSQVSALLSPGSTVIYDSQPAGGVVGGEWAYKGGISVRGTNFVISSAGLGLVGPGDRFPGPDLSAPTNPNGLNYGITSAGDIAATGNGGVLGSGGLIKNSVSFVLSGIAANFDPSTITNVQFQYGTDLSEPWTPTPGTTALIGLAGAISLRRRR